MRIITGPHMNNIQIDNIMIFRYLTDVSDAPWETEIIIPRASETMQITSCRTICIASSWRGYNHIASPRLIRRFPRRYFPSSTANASIPTSVFPLSVVNGLCYGIDTKRAWIVPR